MELFPAARAALCELADAGVPIAIASRASDAAWAEEIMRLMRVDDVRTMADVIGDAPVVIQGGSKKAHLKHIAARSGVRLEEMVFFDNERTNIQEVEKLGVTCVYCPRGMKDGVFRQGLAEYAAMKAATAAQEAGGGGRQKRGGDERAMSAKEKNRRKERRKGGRGR